MRLDKILDNVKDYYNEYIVAFLIVSVAIIAVIATFQ